MLVSREFKKNWLEAFTEQFVLVPHVDELESQRLSSWGNVRDREEELGTVGFGVV